MEGVSGSLIEVTHGPLDPLETKVDQVILLQNECLESLKKIEPQGLEELKRVMAKVPAYIAKIKKLRSEMQACEELAAKITKGVEKLSKA
ncbi:hypothetical protein TVAGG3_0075280 [Trichomonas vaginalis G3]|uniref:hypothetical protein n=1 Tax=Trichomonas vaginalis (strain ATCC PRA-98 / G3) TaxID=412133 RepID=UPI0021E5CCD0|nr:hypothetical protein TVAGG3_0075280 [Trichomonas vaginalis G3]KAI5542805.1 hypothetical protein TVAGG3_0075280 [Trichomonas vaginalis G3]